MEPINQAPVIIKKTNVAAIILTIFLVLAVAAAGVSGYFNYKQYLWLKDSQGWNEKFKVEIDDKAETINSLRSQVTDYRVAEKKANDKITMLEGIVSDNRVSINNLQSTLNQANNNLRIKTNELASTQNDLSVTSRRLTNTESTLAQTQQEVADITGTLNNLQAWVDDNAFLNNNLNAEVTNTLKKPVVTASTGSDAVFIDLNEMGRQMYSSFGFSYKSDSAVSYGRTNDKFYDIYTFWRFKVGDCDDFANFYAAWLRTLKKSYSNAKLNFGSFYLPDSNNHIYIVCGELLNGGGHCVVGAGYISDIKNMYLVEPQGGAYLGQTFDAFKNLWGIFDEDNFYVMRSNGVYSSLSTAIIKANNLLSVRVE